MFLYVRRDIHTILLQTVHMNIAIGLATSAVRSKGVRDPLAAQAEILFGLVPSASLQSGNEAMHSAKFVSRPRPFILRMRTSYFLTRRLRFVSRATEGW